MKQSTVKLHMETSADLANKLPGAFSIIERYEMKQQNENLVKNTTTHSRSLVTGLKFSNTMFKSSKQASNKNRNTPK
jgi:hypothetical protein